MMSFYNAKDEAVRVEMVRSFGLLGNPRPPLHDEVAELAKDLSGVYAAVVTLTDKDRNWYSGSANHPEIESERWVTICAHALYEPLWVEDTRNDERFVENGYVVEAPFVRFFAGVPIIVNGYPVGVLSVYDTSPRTRDEVVISQLSRMAHIIAEDLAHRHRSQSFMNCILASADALINCDDKGNITFWSAGAEALFGYTADEAIGTDVGRIVSHDVLATHGLAFAKWRENHNATVERRIELQARCRDGSMLDIELWTSVAYDQGVPHIHANIRDISERKREAAALKRAKEEAEAANIAKSSFLANMSHELRTPLHGVIGAVELLVGTELTPQQQELSAIVHTSAGHLNRLIGDVLDLAWIESGELQLANAPMSLADVLKGVHALSEIAAQEKGLDLRFRLASHAVQPVLGDALRLKQVLTNLVTNAIKFTPKGSVTVTVERNADSYRFEVKDTGIGFDDEQKSMIFARFHQADATITRKFGGTGLGLAISRDLVAAMGGQLDCASAPQEGATFWFSLDMKLAETNHSQAEIKPYDLNRYGRVLVVDDNATNRRVAELLLTTVGAKVMCVENGEQAVENFKRGAFDVVLMDMMMPVMDGMQATRAIREYEAANGLVATPIIMLTANSLREHEEASLHAGADMYLAKPINPTALYAALGELHHTSQDYIQF